MDHRTSPEQSFDPTPAWEPKNPDYIPPRLETFAPEGLQDKPVPERNWIVPDLVPCGAVTSISGDGGVGKSLLMMQLMTAVALGKQWIGKPTTACRTLGVFCEDEIDELHRRQTSINEFYETDFDGLDDMQWLSRVGENSLMMTFDREDVGTATEFFQQVHNAAQDFGAGLIVLDSLHDLFGGNENNRPQARQFIGLLRTMALDNDGAVVLTAHPSLTGISSGSGTSGSTAWHNAVRSRLYLQRPKVDEGEEVDDFERVLSGKKANYAAGGSGTTSLRWEKGVFIADEAKSGIFGTIERRRVDSLFLEALDTLIEGGRDLSASRNSGSYAPKAIQRTPLARENRLKVHQLEAAMERLFADKIIRVQEHGRPSHRKKRVVRIAAQEASNEPA